MHCKLLIACALAVATTACQVMEQARPAATDAPAYVPANAMPPVVSMASDEIVGPVWQWQRTQPGNSPAVVSAAPERYTLSFQGGGRVNVRADCNRGGASYDVNNVQMKIGAIALTKMACSAGSQDTEFLRSLVQTTSYAIDRGELVLMLADGASMRFRPTP